MEEQNCQSLTLENVERLLIIKLLLQKNSILKIIINLCFHSLLHVYSFEKMNHAVLNPLYVHVLVGYIKMTSEVVCINVTKSRWEIRLS